VSGTLVMSQATYVAARAGIVTHVVDVHWKIANPHAFAGLVTYEELAADAVPVPQLGPGARGLSDAHALLVACVHRVAHHYDADVLIWLYDIHLIVSRITPTEWTRFVRLAARGGVWQISRRSLERTQAAFGTGLPDMDAAGMRVDEATEAATAAFLDARRRPVERVMADLRALPRWRDRVRLVREHVFPSATYMRGRYAPSSTAPLPVLYARRVLRGARKWLARP
jgi:hypothetical protein